MNHTFWIINDILFAFFSISAYLLPLFIIYKNDYTAVDKIVLLGAPLILYMIFSGVVVPIFSKETGVLISSIDIFSVLTLLTTMTWYIFKKKNLRSFIEINIVIHIEVILLVRLLHQLSSIMIRHSLMINLIVIILVMSLQSCIALFIQRLVILVTSKDRLGLFRILLFILILGIYFYKLIFPYFFAGDSLKIVYSGNSSPSPNPDTFSLFMKILLVFLGVFIIVAIVTTRYHLLSDNLKEKTLREQELKNYIKTMEVLQTDIRKIHHDYKNLITALGGYLYDEDDQVDIKGLKSYYRENVLVQKETELKTINLSKLQKLNILEMKGLLAAKLIQASQQSIKVFFEIQEVIDHLPMDKLDLSRIVGILIDNAIEAAAESLNPEIKIALIKEQDLTLFIIENSTLAIDLPISQLNNVGISTKGQYRGLGLHTLSEVLEKYPNIYKETKLENGYFQQKIIFLK